MAKTKKYKNKIGGKVIASGGYGCVFTPALRCENKKKRDKNKISKLMTERHAVQEYEEINEIENVLKKIPNYEDYFLIYDVTLCRPEKLTKEDLTEFDKCTALPKDNITKSNVNSKLDEIRSLNIPNGGLPVDDYIYEDGSFEKIYKTHIQLLKLLQNGIMQMNEHNIYHCDIKDSNVLVDNDGKTRLIDWGLSVQYTKNASEPFPKNWRNRPLQFNVPFSVIIFTDFFYDKYTDYLKNGGKTTKHELKPFVIDYLNEWMKQRGSGHYKFINEIFYMLNSNSLKSISKSSIPSIVETEITIPTIVDYIVNVLEHYTKFKEDGSLNLREYLNEVFIKIIDIWGFINVYFPLLELLYNNYFSLKESEMNIFKHLKYIFNNYLYNPRHELIEPNELIKDLRELSTLLKKTINHYNTNSNSSRSLTKGGKTRKINKLFKRKKLIKKFKNAFLLSLH
jgi:serine/threonine protein kinase